MIDQDCLCFAYYCMEMKKDLIIFAKIFVVIDLQEQGHQK